MASSCSDYEYANSLFDELWPITRSITGPGFESSLELLSQEIPLDIDKYPSGAKVFDWEVPPEWHLRSARLTGPDGDVICDASDLNLHIVNFSAPFTGEMTLDELQPHLHSLPELPGAIPYVTSYYKRQWGFCLSDSVRRSLRPGNYKVHIDSEFIEGNLLTGQVLLPGESDREVLISSYLCHPSLANNELSGPIGLALLFRRIREWDRRRFSYRFLINPETIGALCFLSKYGDYLRAQLEYGLVLTCLGGPSADLRYKSSRNGDSTLDQTFLAASEHLIDLKSEIRVTPFSPVGGSDERQYGSPGFKLPVGQIARTVYGEYSGYHNSLDDKDFMDISQVIKSVSVIEAGLKWAEVASNPVNLEPFGEPQLGKRGLYPNLNSAQSQKSSSDNLHDNRKYLEGILQLLSQADGSASLFTIAKQTEVDIELLRRVCEDLEAANLLAIHGHGLK